MTVTHLFQMKIHTKVAAVVSGKDIKHLPQRFVNFHVDLEPRPYLQLRDRIRVLIGLLVASTVLCLGR